jgi:hypothetical protein
VLLGLVVVGAVAGAAAYRIAQIGRDLLAARDQLNTVEQLLKTGHPTAARNALAVGSARVAHANAVAYNSAELSVFEALPVARQNIKSLRSSVSVALRLTAAGSRLLEAARPLETANGQFEVPLRNGAVPLPVIAALRPQLADLAGDLPSVTESRESQFLLPQVRSLHRAIYRQAGIRRAQAGVLAKALDLLETLSGGHGPRRFVIGVANAAEMRGSGGMILSYGELDAADGKFTLDKFGNIDDLKLTAPVPTPVGTPTDFLQHFGDLGPTLNWRNVNLGADFTFAAPVMEAMFEQATGKAADGVIQIDSMGLAALLKGTGPVDVPGLGQVTADNVVRLTLSDAYRRFPNDRTQRQEVLSGVAEAVFKKLVTGDYPSLRPLATALVQAATQRRILLHVSLPVEQETVTSLAADGALPSLGADFAALTVQNFSANKLDYYLDTALALSGDRKGGVPGHVRAEITLHNTATPGETTPAYVFGPVNSSLKAGQYVGIASLYLPPGATVRAADGIAGTPAVYTEAGRTVVGFGVAIDAGATQRVALDIVLPPAARIGYRFTLPAVSRVRPTQVTVDLNQGPRRLRFSGPLERTIAVT